MSSHASSWTISSTATLNVEFRVYNFPEKGSRLFWLWHGMSRRGICSASNYIIASRAYWTSRQPMRSGLHIFSTLDSSSCVALQAMRISRYKRTSLSEIVPLTGIHTIYQWTGELRDPFSPADWEDEALLSSFAARLCVPNWLGSPTSSHTDSSSLAGLAGVYFLNGGVFLENWQPRRRHPLTTWMTLSRDQVLRTPAKIRATSVTCVRARPALPKYCGLINLVVNFDKTVHCCLLTVILFIKISSSEPCSDISQAINVGFCL